MGQKGPEEGAQRRSTMFDGWRRPTEDGWKQLMEDVRKGPEDNEKRRSTMFDGYKRPVDDGRDKPEEAVRRRPEKGNKDRTLRRGKTAPAPSRGRSPTSTERKPPQRTHSCDSFHSADSGDVAPPLDRDPPARTLFSPSDPEDSRNLNREVDHDKDWVRMVESLLEMLEPPEHSDHVTGREPMRGRTRTFGDPEDPVEMLTNEMPPSMNDNPSNPRRISEPRRTTATQPKRSSDEKWAAMVESVLACMEDGTFPAPVAREKSDRRVGWAEPEGTRQIPQNKALTAGDVQRVSEPRSSRKLPQSRAKDWERYVGALLEGLEEAQAAPLSAGSMDSTSSKTLRVRVGDDTGQRPSQVIRTAARQVGATRPSMTRPSKRN